MGTHIVYVIRSEEGYIYTGVTEDIKNRLEQHNEKSLSFWTKRGNNWRVIYTEEYNDKSVALKRERWLKSGVGREFVKRMILDKEVAE